MPENPNKQEPFTTNQIESEKPAVKRSFNLLTGNIAGSFNAGHNKTIAWREVMAGERIAAEGARLYFITATPKTPALQKLTACVRVYHVPHERVFKNYAKFAGQNGGATEEKIEYLPNFAGKNLPIVNHTTNGWQVGYQETTAWRDSFISSYIPRMGYGVNVLINSEDIPLRNMPQINALLLRGKVIIYNEFERNKEYDAERITYDGDTVSDEEWQSYIWRGSDIDFYTCRARRNNSYYTNYRTELQGYDAGTIGTIDNTNNNNEIALSFAAWESQFAELRSQAEAAQENPWDTMQKLRGAKKLTQGRVDLIAEKKFNLNYSAITQNAYNNNEQIQEKFRVMGFQGGYSFTDIDLTWLNGIEIVEDGYLHVIITVTANTIFESAIERTLLNCHWKDRYRPDLEKDKLDVMYEIEMGTPYGTSALFAEREKNIVGFKRKYNELFKLPNCINGDIMNRGYYVTEMSNQDEININQNTPETTPNDTYQFHETAAQLEYDSENETDTEKYIWKDYSDLMLNKNLAIPQEIGNTGSPKALYIKGENQIIYFGETYTITDMPVSEEIKSNYTKWGEH